MTECQSPAPEPSAHVLAWRQSLALQWQYLPTHVAKRLFDRGRLDAIGFDAALDAGVVGLVKAARDYDPSRGTKFITCAYKYVTHEIWTATRAEALRHARRKGVTVLPLSGLPGDDGWGWGTVPDHRTPERPYHDVWPEVEAAMSQLDPRDRACLDLVYLGGLTLREAGARLGCSKERVRQRIQRAIERLREAVK